MSNKGFEDRGRPWETTEAEGGEDKQGQGAPSPQALPLNPGARTQEDPQTRGRGGGYKEESPSDGSPSGKNSGHFTL